MGKNEEILISASKVFYRKGYNKTKISDIAKESGIGKSTFYDYFKSKDEIYLEVIKYWTEISKNILAEIVELEDSSENKLKIVFSRGMKFLEKNGVNIKATFQETHSLCGAAEGILDKFDRVWYDSIYKILSEGIENGEFKAMNVWSMVYIFEGTIFSYFTDNYLKKKDRNLKTEDLFNDIISCYK